MLVHRSSLFALALALGVPLVSTVGVGTAEARRLIFSNQQSVRVERVDVLTDGLLVVSPGDGSAGSVVAEVESDVGAEDVSLVPADLWLHGGASVAALPKTDADATLTLFDLTGAPLTTFKGRAPGHYGGVISRDGVIWSVATGSSGSCVSRVCDPADPSVLGPDIDVIAGDFYPSGSGYVVALDLAGVDTPDVAYGELTLVEGGVTNCDKVTGECTTTGGGAPVKAAVLWEEVQTVWLGDLRFTHDGEIGITVKHHTPQGQKLDKSKVRLSAPWLDGGYGVTALPTDDDPLTSVALHSYFDFDAQGSFVDALTVVSEGWPAAGELPVEAEIELASGPIIKLRANSLQRAAVVALPKLSSLLRIADNLDAQRLRLTARVTTNDGAVLAFALATPAPLDLAAPTCLSGVCLAVGESAVGEYDLSVTAYAETAASLPARIKVDVLVGSPAEKLGEDVRADTLEVPFDGDLAVVFAVEVGFDEDPSGLGLSGKVKLLGAPSGNQNKQETLSKGKFHGVFGRDGDGDLALAAADKRGSDGLDDLLVVGTVLSLRKLTVSPPAINMLAGSKARLAGRPRAHVVCKFWSANSYSSP